MSGKNAKPVVVTLPNGKRFTFHGHDTITIGGMTVRRPQ